MLYFPLLLVYERWIWQGAIMLGFIIVFIASTSILIIFNIIKTYMKENGHTATGTTNFKAVSQDPTQENNRNNQVNKEVCFIQNYLEKTCDYFIYKLYCFFLIGGNVSMLFQLITISSHQI